MPSSPRSSFAVLGSELRRDERLMNSLVLETLGVLSNTRTEPVFSTTYQRAEFPGACNMAMGCEKAGKLGNTRCTASEIPLPGASPARQVVLEGRWSSPEPAGTGGAALVVAVAAVEPADSLAGVAPSNARTVYEYCVDAVRLVSV